MICAINALVWTKTRQLLTPEEKLESECRKSIASYLAPWNPEIGQKWLDLKSNRVMVHRGLPYWCYDDAPNVSSAIPIERTNYFWTAYQPAQSPPNYPIGADLEKQTRPKTKPLPEEPEPPKKSRVFTLK